MSLISRILLFTLILCCQFSIGQQNHNDTYKVQGQIDSLYFKAFDNVQQTDYKTTLENLKKAKELAKSINNDEKLAQNTSALALVYLMLNDLENASAESVEAIKLQRELHNSEELGKSYITYATINLNAGDLPTAARYFTEAETIFLITQDDAHLARVYLGQGTLHLKNDKPTAAILNFQRAQDYFSNNANTGYWSAKTLLQTAKAQQALKILEKRKIMPPSPLF